MLGLEVYLDVDAVLCLLQTSRAGARPWVWLWRQEHSQALKAPLLAALLRQVEEGREVAKSVATLARVGAPGDGRVISAVVLSLARGGRRQVGRALQRLAERGNPTALEAGARG